MECLEILQYDYMPARGGFTFNQTVNSPKALTPWEVARQARNAARQMAEAMA